MQYFTSVEVDYPEDIKPEIKGKFTPMPTPNANLSRFKFELFYHLATISVSSCFVWLCSSLKASSSDLRIHFSSLAAKASRQSEIVTEIFHTGNLRRRL